MINNILKLNINKYNVKKKTERGLNFSNSLLTNKNIIKKKDEFISFYFHFLDINVKYLLRY
jgi:hypothetical protein